MQAEAVAAPGVSENVPMTQSMHTELLEDAEVGEYEPTGQSSHVPVGDEYLPAAQSMHAELFVAPRTEEPFPVAQRMQTSLLVAPEIDEYLPAYRFSSGATGG